MPNVGVPRRIKVTDPVDGRELVTSEFTPTVSDESIATAPSTDGGQHDWYTTGLVAGQAVLFSIVGHGPYSGRSGMFDVTFDAPPLIGELVDP